MSIFYSIAWQISLFKLISSFISPPQTFFCFLQLKQLKSLIFLVNNFTKNIFYPFLCIKKYPFDKSHRKIIDLSLFMKNIKKILLETEIEIRFRLFLSTLSFSSLFVASRMHLSRDILLIAILFSLQAIKSCYLYKKNCKD